MALSEPWNVRSRARECYVTKQPFSSGEIIITALFPDPDSSGYLRRDHSIGGWNEVRHSSEKPFSFWKSVFQTSVAPPAKKNLEKISTEELFRQLTAEDEPHTENTRYILAVMLERQKQLRETDSQRTADGILRVYEHRKTGEVFLIRDPDIPLSQVESLQQEVFLMLEHGGNPPDPDPPPGSPSSECHPTDA